MSEKPLLQLSCAGCGTRPSPGDPYPFRCPRAGTDDADHVMTAVVDSMLARFPSGDDPNPFVRYRDLSYAHAVATSHGLSDADYVALVRELDRAVAAVDGRGFTVTPFQRSERLPNTLGWPGSGEIWVKDETGNVSGSHKGRHLMGVLIYLAALDRQGLTPRPLPDLAIASCGNAALAAAVVARAGDRRLRVFVPTTAAPSVMARLRALQADIVVCPREPGNTGDPTYHRLQDAVRAGAIPFTCQGPSNGLTIDGGKTIGYEIVSELIRTQSTLDRIFIQVGGGALASACIQAFDDAVRLGVLPRLPRVHAVQTARAHPLRRAYERVVRRILLHALPSQARGLASQGGDEETAGVIAAHAGSAGVGDVLAYAAAHRGQLMWPWEEEPQSVASGILDDETYDWLAVVRGMVRSGGYPVLVSEELLQEAHAIAIEATGTTVDETGSAGLAALLALQRRGAIDGRQRVALLFTGTRR